MLAMDFQDGIGMVRMNKETLWKILRVAPPDRFCNTCDYGNRMMPPEHNPCAKCTQTPNKDNWKWDGKNF